MAPSPIPLSALKSISFQQQTRSASFSFGSLRNSFFKKSPSTTSETTPTAEKEDKGKGKSVFDLAQEDSSVQKFVKEQTREKNVTFHKSSTANFKTSQQKLNDLANLIAGRSVDEGVLQLSVSPKKQAPRLLSMLALARDHAIAKGLRRDKLVIAQSWTSPGPSLPRLDIKGRGRRGIKHHPSSKLHVLLAEGRTKEELGREREKEKWRKMIRGATEGKEGTVRGGESRGGDVGRWRW